LKIALLTGDSAPLNIKDCSFCSKKEGGQQKKDHGTIKNCRPEKFADFVF
jgi:hypothetical protein